jgi:hypothetical protein
MLTKRSAIVSAVAASMCLLDPAAKAGGRRLTVIRNRLFLPVSVNGHRARALVDSAAEASLLDTAFARRIGLVAGDAVTTRGSGGDADAALAKGVVIEALGLRLGPLTVGVLDLSDVGRRLVKAPLPVILGRELFDAARIRVDVAKAVMQTVPHGREPGGLRLPLTTEHGVETFPASIEGHPPVATAFDLGNANEVLVGGDYAQELGLLADRPVVEKPGGGIGGETLRKTFTLRSLEIAGRRFRDVPAALDAHSSATKLNVGVPILRNFGMVADFAGRSLWLTPL